MSRRGGARAGSGRRKLKPVQDAATAAAMRANFFVGRRPAAAPEAAAAAAAAAATAAAAGVEPMASAPPAPSVDSEPAWLLKQRDAIRARISGNTGKAIYHRNLVGSQSLWIRAREGVFLDSRDPSTYYLRDTFVMLPHLLALDIGATSTGKLECKNGCGDANTCVHETRFRVAVMLDRKVDLVTQRWRCSNCNEDSYGWDTNVLSKYPIRVQRAFPFIIRSKTAFHKSIVTMVRRLTAKTAYTEVTW
jgi:hypothetical protein